MRTVHAWVAVALLGGCSGLIGGDDDATSGDAADDPSKQGLDCDDICVGASGMMRLTRTEYAHSVRAVFGADVVVEDGRLPADSTAGSFAANDAPATELGVSDYAAVAWDIAEQVAPGIAAQCGDGCGDVLASTYAEDLFRRPISDEESGEYQALFAWSVAEDGAAGAVELVVATLLQSSHFLYRVELAAEGKEPTLLSGLELASRLAFFLWSEVPDQALRDAALAGELDSPEGLAAMARQMLDDPRGQRAIETFHRQWLGIDDLAAEPALASEMHAETEGFALRVYQSGGTMEELLTSTTSPVGAELAASYGVAPGEEVQVPGHVGILSHASVMSTYGSTGFSRPVWRGNMLLNRVTCTPVGSPPPNAVQEGLEQEQQITEDMTDREKLEIITGGPACIGCHRTLNPAGYAFEGFGSDGFPRATDDAGRPIETDGELVGFGESDGAFEGLHDLMPRLAASEEVARCLSEQWVTYALRRPMAKEDIFSIEAAMTDGELADVLVQLVTTDAFRYRLPR